jgi:hypothetical protein
MQCTRPIGAVQFKDGSILFDARGEKHEATLSHALERAHRAGEYAHRLQLRCRLCAACRYTHATMWAVRLEHELQAHDRSSFITLTYSDEHIPPGGTLDHRHVQLFLKRLRKSIAPTKIRYFVAGEYGTETHRPHYHLIIYGYDFPDKKAWSTGKKGNLNYISDQLEKCWGLGYCTVGTVSAASIAYVARYNLKKLTDDKAMNKNPALREMIDLQTGQIHMRRPEYVRMSLKPGLGYNWFESNWDELRKGFVTLNGTKRPIPNYYLGKLSAIFPDEFELLAASREAAMNERPALTQLRLDALHEFNLVQSRQLTREVSHDSD